MTDPGDDRAVFDLKVDDKCAVCLEHPARPCLLQACRHTFCYDCIAHWSQVNPSCPQCKQPFSWLLVDIMSNSKFNVLYVASQRLLPHGVPAWFSNAQVCRWGVYHRGLVPAAAQTDERKRTGSTRIPPVTRMSLNSRGRDAEIWFQRELQSITKAKDASAAYGLLFHYLQKATHSSRDSEFHKLLSQLIPAQHVVRFISEFEDFIASPFSLADYDMHKAYTDPESGAIGNLPSLCLPDYKAPTVELEDAGAEDSKDQGREAIAVAAGPAATTKRKRDSDDNNASIVVVDVETQLEREHQRLKALSEL